MCINKRLAIIGGGFSGLMTLRHLVDSSDKPLFIRLYDKRPQIAKGLAYKSSDPAHLLNVPAAKMGAFADSPQDFWEWMQANAAKWQRLHPDFEKAEYKEDSFVPRMIYAAYLKDVLCQTLKLAKQRQHHVEVRTFMVRHVSEDLRVTDTSGEVWQADRVILATGHPGARHFPFERLKNDRGFLHELWDERAELYWAWFERKEWDNQSHAVILGTGLSAVDMLHSLHTRGFKGKITMISRHGKLPKVHKLPKKPHQMPDILEFPRTALGIYQKLHQAIERSDLEERDWRGVIDSIRPITNQLWERFPMNEKRRFLSNFLSWWNVLRHRMPQESFDLVTDLQSSGQLQLMPGHVLHLSRDQSRFTMCIKQRGSEESHCFSTDTIINACGFNYDIAESGSPFLMDLRDRELIEISPLRMGIRTDGAYRAHGLAYGRIYALGPLLFGERLESTAVPELRQQAKECAQIVLNDLYSKELPERAMRRISYAGDTWEEPPQRKKG
jgi:uncharacterized NAD(P)/FAD-binding protein YdhS